MMIGKKLAMTAGDVATLQPPNNETASFHRIRLETSAGFDRTITLKKRTRVEPGTTALTALTSWYKKESDGTTASAALTPGASNKSEYVVDGVAGIVTVEVSGGTTGTVDAYWTTVTAETGH